MENWKNQTAVTIKNCQKWLPQLNFLQEKEPFWTIFHNQWRKEEMQYFVNKIISLIGIVLLNIQSVSADPINVHISPLVSAMISNDYITKDGLKTIYGHGGLGLEGSVVFQDISVGAILLNGSLPSFEVSYSGTNFSGTVENKSRGYWFAYKFLAAPKYSLSVQYAASEHKADSNDLSGVRSGENINLKSNSFTKEKKLGLRSRYFLNRRSQVALGLYLKFWDFNADGDTLVGNLKVKKSISHSGRDLGLEVSYLRSLSDQFDVELELSSYGLSFEPPTRSTGLTLKTTYKF